MDLEISDTGSGLTPEECERLFTPYYTTKQHGTGLGLAIVQSVVSDHGGRISVESETGVGTSSIFISPASRRCAAIPCTALAGRSCPRTRVPTGEGSVAARVAESPHPDH